MEKLKKTLRKIPRNKYIFLLFVAIYIVYIIVKCAGGLGELGETERIAAYVGMGIFATLSATGILLSAFALLTGNYLEQNQEESTEPESESREDN